MLVKISFLVVFVAIMVGVGFYCRRRATDVNGFVLGGRSVGPWLTAFSYGTSYFSACAIAVEKIASKNVLSIFVTPG